MSEIPILSLPRREWACPNCQATDVTHESRPHTRMHACAGLHGLTTPMQPAVEVDRNTVDVRLVEREDYVGDEHGITYDQTGRAIMAVETLHADGSNDIAVYAPIAKAKGRTS